MKLIEERDSIVFGLAILLLILSYFISEELIYVLFSVICIWLIYKEVYIKMYLRSKQIKERENMLYEFKPRGDLFSVIVAAILTFNIFSSSYRSIKYNSIGELVEITNIGHFISLLDIGNLSSLCLIIIFFLVKIVTFIYDLRHGVRIYEDGILLLEGNFIPYTDIKSICKKEIKKNVRYEIEIKKYSGTLLIKSDIKDGTLIDKILIDKSLVGIKVINN